MMNLILWMLIDFASMGVVMQPPATETLPPTVVSHHGVVETTTWVEDAADNGPGEFVIWRCVTASGTLWTYEGIYQEQMAHMCTDEQDWVEHVTGE
jgi:hypothetical protein